MAQVLKRVLQQASTPCLDCGVASRVDQRVKRVQRVEQGKGTGYRRYRENSGGPELCTTKYVLR